MADGGQKRKKEKRSLTIFFPANRRQRLIKIILQQVLHQK